MGLPYALGILSIYSIYLLPLEVCGQVVFITLPPKSFVLLSTVLCVLFIVLCAFPGASNPLSSGKSFIAISVIAFGFASCIWSYITCLIGSRPVSSDRCLSHRSIIKQFTRWAILPMCLIAVLSAEISKWPLRVAFQLSSADFEDAVCRLSAGNSLDIPRNFGVYEVQYIRNLEDGAFFFQTGRSFGDRIGFSYRPGWTIDRPSIKRVSRNWFVEVVQW